MISRITEAAAANPVTTSLTSMGFAFGISAGLFLAFLNPSPKRNTMMNMGPMILLCGAIVGAGTFVGCRGIGFFASTIASAFASDTVPNHSHSL